MAKYIDADLLRKEIERLKDEYTDIAIDSRRGWVNANSVIDDLEQLQFQIDSLQQKQPEKPIPKDLDFEQELYNHFGQIRDFTLGMRIGQYFYNLGRDSVPLPEDTVLFNKGVAEGKRLMMKEAVEGQVFGATDVKALYEGKVYVVSNLVQDTDYNLHPNDKVRVIIIPKTDEK